MRIALVITELFPGGAEKCLVHLACFLHREGHDVEVWQLGSAPPPDKATLTERLEREGIAWHSGDIVKPWQFPGGVRWLRRELRRFQPDVTQAFLFHANLAAAIACRGLPCRLFGGARVRQPQRWRQRLQRCASARMEKLICVSESVARHCEHQEGISAERLIVIPNGIEQPEYRSGGPESAARLTPSSSRRATGDGAPDIDLPTGARVLLFLGRLADQKGVEPLLRLAADPLLERLPEHHLVGRHAGFSQQARRPRGCRSGCSDTRENFTSVEHRE